jgi:hypothetical protein
MRDQMQAQSGIRPGDILPASFNLEALTSISLVIFTIGTTFSSSRVRRVLRTRPLTVLPQTVNGVASHVRTQEDQHH